MRNKFEFQEVPRGAHFSQLQLDRAEFRYCETKTRLPERPSAYFEHIRVGSLKARRSKIRYSTLNDVRIGKLDLDTDSSFLVGNTYFGVVFEGTVKSGLIFLAVSPLSDDASGQWEAIRSAEADPAWSVDISRMSGHVSVRGYSADGFIINREFQCIVRNDPTSFKGWRAFDFGDSLFPYSLDLMERMGWRDTVLSADATSPDFSSQVELIHKLRAIGISE